MMQLVANLDRPDDSFNNEAMYQRAAQRVKDWRKDHDEMNQVTFAKLAKISVGCLQGFESGARATRDTNLIKIAAVLGLTKDALLGADQVSAEKPNPLLVHLRTEDLQLANRFHHASVRTKHAVDLFFRAPVADEHLDRIALILEHMLRLTIEHLPVIEDLLRAIEADDHAPISSPTPHADSHPSVKAPHKKSS